ncbi:hypothetical protein Tco_0667990 [Tanacetum coccineum]
MMTARKRVGPLPTHHLAMRHSVDYSSSVNFSLDDSSRDSSSSSSSETSSDSSADALSDSASSRSSSDHSLPTPSLGMRPSHHLCNTPKTWSQRNVFPGALLHDPITQVRRERPLTESFEKKSCKFGLQCTSSMSYIYFT